MSSLSSYPTKAFKETQKFLVIDPSTGSAAFVVGSDLVSYISPSLNAVKAESTRLAAENTDYEVGTVIQTTGAAAIGDGQSAVYLVVAPGEGDFPMLNGNELLVVAGDELLREQLASNAVGEGTDLIAHTGTGDTVTEALNKRDIYVDNIASLAALDISGLTEGYPASVVNTGRAGDFVWRTGDQSANVTADTQQGIWVAPDSAPTGASGAWSRFGYEYLTVEMFGAGETSNDTSAFNGVKAIAEKGTVVYCPSPSYTITSFDFDADLFFIGRGRRGTKITVTGFATDADTSEKYGIRLIGTVADGLASSPKMLGFEVENTTAEPGVNGFLVRRKSIIEDVYQHGATQDGWHFNTDAANNASFFSRFTDVWGKFNGRHGCNVQRGANANIFTNCQFDSNGSFGLIQQTNGIAINGNIIIGGQASFNGDRGYELASGTNLQLAGCYAEFNGTGLSAPAWSPSFSYTAGDLITSPSSGLSEGQTSVVYEAASDHTSSASFDSDYLSGRWIPYGTEMRVSNSVTFSYVRLGLALSNKTDRIRNDSAQITTKVALGGLLINQSNLESPNVQRLRYRDGLDIGRSTGSVTNYIDVGSGEQAKTIYREAGIEIFGVEYDGTPANPNNLLKITSGTAGVLSVDCLIIEQDGGIRMPNLPTASAGLPSGSLWNDAGTVKIV